MVKRFRREQIHPWLPVCNQFPCTTCDVSVSTFENNVCRETTSFKPFNPPKCYSEEKQKRWERIFVLTNFANANFRPGEISAKRNFASMGCEILPRLQRNLKFAGAWTNFGDGLSSNVRENKRNRRISLYFCTPPYSKFVNSLCRRTEYIGLKIPTWVRFKRKRKRRERQKVKGKTRVVR